MADLSIEDGAPSGQFTEPPAPSNLLDVSVLVAFLRRMVPANMEPDGVLLDSFRELLLDKTTVERLQRFISDPQCKAISIQRQLIKDDDEEDSSNQPNSTDLDNVVYSIIDEVKFTSPKITNLVLIKRGPILGADKLLQQACFQDFDESTPYEDLHLCASAWMGPFFKSFIKTSGRAERDGDKINDHVFLNHLQSCVTKWIREIQKVTKLDRDPSSGTSQQEISFWQNLERALLRIQEKRESVEVVTTLEILNMGKRFYATVRFDTDTRLKEAIEMADNYNPLMKDFPLNDLLASTDLDRIQLALKARPRSSPPSTIRIALQVFGVTVAETSQSTEPGHLFDDVYRVERILRQRRNKRKIKYFIKWDGYSDADNTWEPAKNILDSTLIEDFKKCEADRRKRSKARTGGDLAVSTGPETQLNQSDSRKRNGNEGENIAAVEQPNPALQTPPKPTKKRKIDSPKENVPEASAPSPIPSTSMMVTATPSTSSQFTGTPFQAPERNGRFALIRRNKMRTYSIEVNGSSVLITEYLQN